MKLQGFILFGIMFIMTGAGIICIYKILIDKLIEDIFNSREKNNTSNKEN